MILLLHCLLLGENLAGQVVWRDSRVSLTEIVYTAVNRDIAYFGAGEKVDQRRRNCAEATSIQTEQWSNV